MTLDTALYRLYSFLVYENNRVCVGNFIDAATKDTIFKDQIIYLGSVSEITTLQYTQYCISNSIAYASDWKLYNSNSYMREIS